MSMLRSLITSEEGKLAIAAITGFVSATVLAWLTEYFRAKGKTFATKQDFDELKRQLQENTAITRSIEQRYSREDILWKSELEFREKQLSELYGPAYGIIKSEKEIFDLWITGKMKDVNLKVKQLFDKHNKFLMNLIANETHLIDGASMPESFVRFNTNSIVWGLYRGRLDTSRFG
jgi:hypothetical protein